MPTLIKTGTAAVNDDTIGTLDWQQLDGALTDDGVRAFSIMGGASARIQDVRLFQALGAVGQNKAANEVLDGSYTEFTFGNALDKWGTSLSVSAVQNADFGVGVVVYDGVGATKYLRVKGFDFADIPTTATITGFRATVQAAFDAASHQPRVELVTLAVTYETVPSVPSEPSIGSGCAPGFIKIGAINGGACSIDSAGWEVTGNYTTNDFAGGSFSGPKQRVIHARGTAEVLFNMSGDVTAENGGVLLGLLAAASRGVPFTTAIQQGLPGDLLSDCYLESLSLSGSAHSIAKYSLSGKCTSYPVSSSAIAQLQHPNPIPGWATGAYLATSWDISVSVPLTPMWRNDQRALPAYYRAGSSQYSMSVTTVCALQEHSMVSIAVGSVGIISGLVTTRGMVTGGPNEAKTYKVMIQNISVDNDPQTSGI